MDSMTKILVANSNLIKKKAIPRKEALQKYNEDYILKKYPKLKKELSKKHSVYTHITNAEYLAYDRAMWACHNRTWVNS